MHSRELGGTREAVGGIEMHSGERGPSGGEMVIGASSSEAVSAAARMMGGDVSSKDRDSELGVKQSAPRDGLIV
jgi:hypothetical protein